MSKFVVASKCEKFTFIQKISCCKHLAPPWCFQQLRSKNFLFKSCQDVNKSFSKGVCFCDEKTLLYNVEMVETHTAVQVDPGSKKRSTPNSAAIKFFFISHFRKRWEINLTAGEFWENIIFAILKKRIFKRLVKINFFRK